MKIFVQKMNRKKILSQYERMDATMEPPMGFEPTTYALRVHCSTSWARMANSRIIEKNSVSASIILKKLYTPRPFPLCTRQKCENTLFVYELFRPIKSIGMTQPRLETEKRSTRLTPEGEKWKISTRKWNTFLILFTENDMLTPTRTYDESIAIKQWLFESQYMVIEWERKWIMRVEESSWKSLIYDHRIIRK